MQYILLYNSIIEDADARPPPLSLVSMRLGYRECLQVSGGFWQSFGRWGNCKSCLHARMFSCRLVIMQDCFHADCLHARLFPCKIAFMQDFMQHAGGFLCIFAKLGPKSTPEAPKSTPEAPKSIPEAPKTHPGSSPETRFA